MTAPTSAPRPGQPAVAPAPSGARLGRSRVLLFFGIGLAVVIVLAVVAVLGSTEPPPDPRCPNPPACGGPPPRSPGTGGPVSTPEPGTGAAPLPNGELWQSPELGFEIEYSSDYWALGRSDARWVQLVPAGQPNGFDYVLYIEGAPAGEATAEQVQQAFFESERGGIPDLVPDTSPYNAIQGPSIGYLDGTGASYAGTLENGTPIGIAILAASDGHLTVGFEVVVTNPNVRPDPNDWPTFQYLVRSWGDSVLKSFRWEPRP